MTTRSSQLMAARTARVRNGGSRSLSLQMEALGEIAPGKEMAGASDCHAMKQRLHKRQGSQGLHR